MQHAVTVGDIAFVVGYGVSVIAVFAVFAIVLSIFASGFKH